MLQQVAGDTIDSHDTGLFTARLPMRVLNGVNQNFDVRLYMANCAVCLIIDTQGHDAGDKYIKSACSMICSQFKHSPVYRIGGDEFVAFHEGEDYLKREVLLMDFNHRIEENQKLGRVVVSCGFDIFDSDKHATFISVFERADKKMYDRKRALKEMLK